MFFRQYERPETEDEAVDLLRKYGRDARILAGGTDLIVKMRRGHVNAQIIIDISELAGLKSFVDEEKKIEIGAMIRLSALQRCRKLQGPYRVLGDCAGHVSSIQIRNMATVGGNSCNASPSADTAPAMLLLDAQACIRGKSGYRYVEMNDFYRGPGKSAVESDEILSKFIIPRLPEKSGTAYFKYAIRGDSDISIVGAGARLDMEGNKIIDARLSFASVGPRTIRLEKAEGILKGENVSRELFEEAANLCARECSPITDQRATEGYRRKMVAFWTVRALEQALNNVKKDGKEYENIGC